MLHFIFLQTQARGYLPEKSLLMQANDANFYKEIVRSLLISRSIFRRTAAIIASITCYISHLSLGKDQETRKKLVP
ncbi:hypothetical protein [Nostoc sp.]|uniref:hypothetical protein n=1 Tax=Nostoc sp. TaxID=1180 RepID=UPI002FFA9B08